MTTTLQYPHARYACQQLGGDLLTAFDNNVTNFYRDATVGLNNPSFVGLMDTDDSLAWRLDGSVQPITRPPYHVAEPSVATSACHSVYQLNTDSASLGDTACTVLSEYVCQIKTSLWCPPPYVPYHGHCLLVYNVSSNFTGARQYCTQNAGDLARADTSDRLSLVVAFLGELGALNKNYYLGVAVSSDRSVFIEQLSYNTVPQRCIRFTNSSKIAVNCSESNLAVCEYLPFIGQPQTVANPNGTQPLNLLTVSISNTWSRARSYCQSMGGDFVTGLWQADILNQTTSFVASNTANWIGIVDMITPAFIDGFLTPYPYHGPWNASQPSSLTEKCGSILGGAIYDTSCDVLTNFVCQLPIDAPKIVNYRPDLRLSQGSNYGSVEVYNTQRWKKVCIAPTNLNAVNVVCRQLGYSSGRVTSQSSVSTARLIISTCTGSESHLGQCQYNLTMSDVNCTTAFILCSSPVKVQTVAYLNSGDVRVLDPASNQWLYVCNSSFDDADAQVACRAMGYSSGFKTASTSGNQSGIVKDLQCYGNETNFGDCGHMWLPFGDSCQPAAIFCNSTVTSTRLQYENRYGNAEVLIAQTGNWSSICRNSTSLQLLMLMMCHSFGYANAKNQSSTSGAVVNTTVMDCSATDTLLSQCKYRISSTACVPAYFVCYNQIFDARLSQSTNYGELQVTSINDDPTWQRACMTGGDTAVAAVTCRRLGFNTSSIVSLQAINDGRATAFTCVGNESNIMTCPNPPLTWHSVNQSCQSAFIRCTFPLTIRLSKAANYGRVETLQVASGTWMSSICAADNLAATTVCRQMGFTNGSAVTLNPAPINGTIDQLTCTGTEPTINNCKFTIPDSVRLLGAAYPCTPAEVQCYQPVTVRFVTGVTRGDIEVFHQYAGKWGHVCNNNFDDNDAGVVCRQLGFNTGHALAPTAPLKLNASIDLLDCTGQEGNLGLCRYSFGLPTNSCLPARVSCSDQDEKAMVIRRYQFLRVTAFPGGNRLDDHLMETRSTRTYVDCSTACVDTVGCQSINFNPQLPTANCELNDATDVMDPLDFISAPSGWNYYYKIETD